MALEILNKNNNIFILFGIIYDNLRSVGLILTSWKGGARGSCVLAITRILCSCVVDSRA